MNVSIVFDKSALQSLGVRAIREVGHFFQTVVPPVLLYETLGDLATDKGDKESRRAKVAELADKLFPLHTFNNVHFRTLCIHNLLGERISMKRRPIVAGARRVESADGSFGVILDHTAESDAVLRWRSGNVTEDDFAFAKEWRTAARGCDLEGMKRQLPKPEFRVKTMDEVAAFVKVMMDDAEYQMPLLVWFLSLVRCDEENFKLILDRWRRTSRRWLRTFAPYAFHCIKVHTLFYFGYMQGILGSRSSNIVDIEYLCYTPFAHAFCSGDNLHAKLAPLILDADQSCIDRDTLRTALEEIHDARARGDAEVPSSNSIVTTLWKRHLQLTPSPYGAKRLTLTDEDKARIADEMAPIIDAIRRHKPAPQPRFPR